VHCHCETTSSSGLMASDAEMATVALLPDLFRGAENAPISPRLPFLCSRYFLAVPYPLELSVVVCALQTINFSGAQARQQSALVRPCCPDITRLPGDYFTNHLANGKPWIPMPGDSYGHGPDQMSRAARWRPG